MMCDTQQVELFDDLHANRAVDASSLSTVLPGIDLSTVSYRKSTYYGLTEAEFDFKYGRIADLHKSRLVALRQRLRCSFSFTLEVVKRRLPFIRMLQQYQWKKWVLCDIVAGVSLGMMTIPQSLGYAVLASVPPILGLYTSFFPSIIYFFFTTSNHVSIGTMPLASLVVSDVVNRGIAVMRSNSGGLQGGNDTTTAFSNESAHTFGEPEENQERTLIAISVAFLSGLVLVAMCLCRLGFIVSYMSEAFVSGYLAASYLRVLTLQVRLCLGEKAVDRSNVKVGEYFYLIYDIFANLGETNLVQLGISVVAIIALVIVKKCINERFKSRLKVPIPIDLIIIIIATIASHFGKFESRFAVVVLREIQKGIPSPMLPSTQYMTLFAFDAVMLAIISYMVVAMMAKLFADRHGYVVDNNQELLANGLACIGGSLFGSFAASTSPPRCFLNESMGGRTQISHLVSALVILLTLLFVAPLFYAMPLCILSSIVIVACIPLFKHYRAWITYWRTDQYDLAIWLVTAVTNLLISVDIGLILGIAFNLIIVHYRMQRPHATTLSLYGNDVKNESGDFIFLDDQLYDNFARTSHQHQPFVIFRFESPLYFATLDVFKKKLSAVVKSHSKRDRWPMAVKLILRTEDGSCGVGRNGSRNCTVMNTDDDIKMDRAACSILTSDSGTGDKAEKIAFEKNASGIDIDGMTIKITAHPDEKPLQEGQDIDPGSMTVILDFTAVPFIDTGGARLLGRLQAEYSARNVKLVIAGCCVRVRESLNVVDSCKELVVGGLFPSIEDAVVAVLR